jgi:hypothetical protein
MTPFNPEKENQRFGSKYCLHLHGRNVSQTRNQHSLASQKAELFKPTSVRTLNPIFLEIH